MSGATKKKVAKEKQPGHVIRIDEDVWEKLKGAAEPFASPNATLRKLLKLPAKGR